MIESISIANEATYGAVPESLTKLSKFNFIFGSNGNGKTTISRIIDDQDFYPSCEVKWKLARRLETLVYNRDFVELNFNQSNELKGVFTLGEMPAGHEAKITLAKIEQSNLESQIAQLSNTLAGSNEKGGKKADLALAEEKFKEQCWMKKKSYDDKLWGGFEGYRNSAEKFKAKIIQESESNTALLKNINELETKAKSIFGTTPTQENLITKLDFNKILELETHSILSKRVIGKNDVDIAAMINKLGNSDWVSQGRFFHKHNDDICPFCQQGTPESFSESLNNYFDETFLTETKKIDDLLINYEDESNIILQKIDFNITGKFKYLESEKLASERSLLDSAVIFNLQLIKEKKKEYSKIIELKSLKEILKSIHEIIDNANSKALEHNKMVANIANERDILTKQIWKFVINELDTDLQNYKRESLTYKRAIESLNNQIIKKNEQLKKNKIDLYELEKQATSVLPTIVAINSLLDNFGFSSFKLAPSSNNKFYKLIRPNGMDAKITLSEGEKTFVSFLYFFHLLKGSNSESGISNNRIVVFDDPVSSLDSDILFIVSSLIKSLFEEVRDGSGNIKQIFILTHNVYFHKEVSFNQKRKGTALSDETFWIVRKLNSISKIDRYTSNPIKTSYDMLWEEVRRTDRSNLTIQNTLRRILENYFKLLGGVDSDEICEKFDGHEKFICKSLFSWINDGSHFAHDDIYVATADSQIEKYLHVFKNIFEKEGHISHYKMMMGDAYQEANQVV